jgi:hypothetical protein
MLMLESQSPYAVFIFWGNFKTACLKTILRKKQEWLPRHFHDINISKKLNIKMALMVNMAQSKKAH